MIAGFGESLLQMQKRRRPDIFEEPQPAQPPVAAATNCVAAAPAERDIARSSNWDPTASTTASKTITRPEDFPAVKHARRGASDSAFETLREKEIENLLADLHRDKIAATSQSSDASLHNMWCKFHAEIFGDTSPVLPLTMDRLVSIGAVFKGGNYRSFPNCVSVMKRDTSRLGIHGPTSWSMIVPGLPAASCLAKAPQGRN